MTHLTIDEKVVSDDIDSSGDIEIGDDIDNNDTDDAITDQLVLALAAHPLSSCNPPPRELPDLLDGLIASHGRLSEQIMVTDKVGQGIARRLENLRIRLQRLRAANEPIQKLGQAATKNRAGSTFKMYQIFKAQERVLQRMCLQVAFVHWTFVYRVKGMTMSSIKAHHDILDEFLGQRHHHPSIQVADSTKLLCTPGCDWYEKHGPYEWSKKPYSDVWWQAMNHTDWDWLRIKEHIVTAVTVGGGKVAALYQKLQANSMKFIPSWFWSEDFESWTIHGDIESINPNEGGMEGKVVVKVRFNKSPAMIEQERVRKVKEMEQARMGEDKGGADGLGQSTTESATEIEIEKIGETIIDENMIFDGMASSPSRDGRTQHTRWLFWWGFEKWHAETFKRPARQGPATMVQWVRN